MEKREGRKKEWEEKVKGRNEIDGRGSEGEGGRWEEKESESGGKDEVK